MGHRTKLTVRVNPTFSIKGRLLGFSTGIIKRIMETRIIMRMNDGNSEEDQWTKLVIFDAILLMNILG
jgi:hypothetical protein